MEDSAKFSLLVNLWLVEEGVKTGVTAMKHYPGSETPDKGLPQRRFGMLVHCINISTICPLPVARSMEAPFPDFDRGFP